MAIINVDLGNIPETTLLDKGEYEVRVVGKPVVKTSQAGNNYINVALEALDNPTADTVYHILTLPNQGEIEKHSLRRRRDIASLCATFGVDHNNGELDLDQFEGKSGYVLMGIEEGSGNYPQRNKVTSLLPAR